MARTTEEREIIWRTMLRDVERFTMTDGSGSIGTVNSKRWETINDELEALAAMLVDELHEAEQDSLTSVTEAIWQDIHDRLLSWAAGIDKAREDYRRKYIEPALVQ